MSVVELEFSTSSAEVSTVISSLEVGRKITLSLGKFTTEDLKVCLAEYFSANKINHFMHLSAELSRRGIPPCFRMNFAKDVVWIAGDSEEAYFLMLADFEWIIFRYPTHKVAWKCAESLFAPGKFKKTAQYLRWDGKRASGQIATALALTIHQQRECAWIQSLAVRRWRDTLIKRMPVARAVIAAHLASKDKRPMDDVSITIDRRFDIWLCGQFGGNKPQHTANFYKMLTGQKLPRNIVAKQLQKIPVVRRRPLILSSIE